MAAMSEVGLPAPAAPPDPAQISRDALARHAWQEAFEQLSQADRDGQLSGVDLAALALAAFFGAHADGEVAIKERAFKAYEAEGNGLRAAYLALDVARRYGVRGKVFDRLGVEGPGRADPRSGRRHLRSRLPPLLGSEQAAAAGDVGTALSLAERAVEIGKRVSEADLTAYAPDQPRRAEDRLRRHVGRVDLDGRGLHRGRERRIVAVHQRRHGPPHDRSLPGPHGLPPGQRVDRGDREVLRSPISRGVPRRVSGPPRGSGRSNRCRAQAEQDLERATIELGAYRATPPQADGFYAIGDIRRLKGDFEGAETALREAHARGRSPHPALALVRLAEGKVKAAAAAIDAAVAETWDRWARARLLPVQAEISIAAGDVARARTAVDELATIVAGYPSPALEAGRKGALGRVLVAEGDAPGATRELRAAIKGCREVGAPYEIARARQVLSRALRVVGNEDYADLETGPGNFAHDTKAPVRCRRP